MWREIFADGNAQRGDGPLADVGGQATRPISIRPRKDVLPSFIVPVSRP